MIGTFGYLITAQFLVCYLSGIKKIYKYMANAFSCLGIILYFFVIQKEQVTYTPSKYGMTYSFNPGLWNNLYIGYTIVLAINMLQVIIYMLRNSPTQRLKDLGKQLLLIEIIIILGMLFDTIFPIIGMGAIPGSSLAQFLGMAVMYHAIIFVSHSRINVGNMSEFIYYSLTVPGLGYDAKHKLQILNDTAYSFLGVENDIHEHTSIDQLFSFQEENIFDFKEKSKEVDAICCHNQLYCSLTINKICDKYGDIIGHILIVTDLSERMKSMKNLEEAMKEAEYANKAKSIFLANMSHEIRTPMNAIIGFSELVLKMDINTEIRKHIEDIKWSSNNLLAIINDILDISKIESGKAEIIPDNYHTGSLFSDVSLIIAPQAGKKGLAFDMKIEENIPRELYGDKVRIRGVLINILNNAVKYTQKGNVLFEASILKLSQENVTLEFKISDTGVGIKKEDLKNVFHNFERLDQKIHYGIEGSGLGLAIANEYVSLMGGNITVESIYGEGSVFTVRIEQKIIDSRPLEKDYSKLNPEHISEGISDLKIEGLSVLVADDNLINLRVACGILSYYGLSVDTATTGKEAIQLCKNKKYSLVFMDQMMPEMDGVEAMQELRTLNSHYALGGEGKIIVLTADAIKGTREHLIKQGFDEYLGKPINIEQLERMFLQFIPKDKISFQPKSNQEKGGSNLSSCKNCKNSCDDTNSSDSDSSNSKDENQDLKYLKEQLPLMDVEKGISNCGGHIQDYLEILKITYEYGEKQLEELKMLWSQKDYENYVIKIHSMKSTSLNIGAANASQLAREQEEKGKAGDFAYIDEHMELFQKEYTNILTDLERVLIHYEQIHIPSETEDLPTLEETMIKPILQNIERSVDDFDFGKVFGILEEMKNYQLPEKYKEMFSKIETYMEDFSVEEIKELLSREP